MKLHCRNFNLATLNNSRAFRRMLHLAAASLLVVAGCGDKPSASAQTPAAAGDGSGKPAEMIKLSQFGMSTWCGLASGPDSTIHAVFTDAKAAGKLHYLYYRASKDNGTTWSEPKNLTDDESELSAGPCRVVVDGGGRVYAIWKYIDENELLEGPNGYANGILAVRVLDGGSWSKPQLFGDAHKPIVSWYAAIGPDKKVNVVYSHADEAVDWALRGGMHQYANNVDQLTFDGAGAPKVTSLRVARHVLTQAEQDAMKAAGKYPAYEDTVPKFDGLWNLNGYIADDGRPRFLAEGYQESSQTAEQIQRFDGQKFAKFYDYKGYLGYNSFSWPPVMVREADGKEHVLRKPEKTESDVVRDYAVDNGEPGDKTDVIADASEKAKILGWWASPLDGGKVAAMASVQPNVSVMGPTDLYVAIGDGKGVWTKPINVTDNEAREKFFAKAGMSQSTSYAPKYAQATALKDGTVGVIMLNAEHTISGINTVAITGGGTAVTGLSTFSTENPYVTFTKVKG